MATATTPATPAAAARRMLAVVLLAAVVAPAAIAEEAAASPAGRPGASAGETPANPAAEAVIDRFNAMLIDIMQRADELGYQGRFELVAGAVGEAFDVPFMAAKTLGSHWRRLDEADRRRWVETFRQFTVSSYADKFDGYSGESIEIVGRKPASRDTLVVLTRLIRPDDDDVDLDYRMREGDDGWRVVDIYSDGKVSEVALRRSEYAAVLRQGGIDGLIAAVSEKTARRAAKHS